MFCQDCVVPAKRLLYMINNRQPDIMTDVLISVVKVTTNTCRCSLERRAFIRVHVCAVLKKIHGRSWLGIRESKLWIP